MGRKSISGQSVPAPRFPPVITPETIVVIHPGYAYALHIQDIERSPKLNDDLLRQILAITWVAALGVANRVENLLLIRYQALKLVLKRRSFHILLFAAAPKKSLDG